MNISLIAYILILFAYVITQLIIKKKESRENVFLIVSFSILFIILAIREPVVDAPRYLDQFHLLHNSSIKDLFSFKEFLFKILSFAIGQIWYSDRAYLIIISLLTLAGPFFIIKRYSRNHLLSILLFVCIGGFSMHFYVLRQAIATSIILFSFKFAEEDKPFKYLLSVIMASLFHTSALITAPLCLLRKLKTKTQIILTAAMLIPAFLFRSQLHSLINLTFYSDYIGTNYDTANHGYGKLILIVAITLLYIIIRYRTPKEKQEKEQNSDIEKTLTAAAIIGIFLQILSTTIAIATRLVNYFAISYCILPASASRILNKKTKICINIAIILLMLIYIVYLDPIRNYSTIFGAVE